MSTHETDADEEAVSDREKARCRRNRRPSVQFIDKNLIRRRSLGQEKFLQQQQQQSRLPSIHAIEESESAVLNSQRPDCEIFRFHQFEEITKTFFFVPID
jgi:hypothetical protein